jgi:glycosyltransferase domain-containing protein
MNSMITLAIPIYNEGATVRRCLESAVEQTVQGIQIIISDNCSTDSTPSICKEFVTRYPQIEYYRQPINIGAEKNFLFLLQQAKSKYIMFLAGDDWLDKGFISAAIDFLEAHPKYIMATCTSVYYDQVKGDRQFATCSSSIEADEPAERVVRFLQNLTDNSEFYGVFHRIALNSEKFPVVGSDWIWMMKLAFAGKIKSLKGLKIHRTNRWDRRDRHQQVVKGEKLPMAQAEQPHYATALYAMLYFATAQDFLAEIPQAKRLHLAWRVFTEMKNNQQLPKEFHVWQDCLRFFGDEFVAKHLAPFRYTLLEQCVNWVSDPHEALDPELVLEIALTLKMCEKAPTPKEIAKFDMVSDALKGNMTSFFAANALYYPAFRQKMLPGLTEIPEFLHALTISYLLEDITIFENEEDIEQFRDHVEQVLNKFDDEITLGQDIFPWRLSKQKIKALELLLTCLRIIPTYFSKRNLRSLLEKRGRLARYFLKISGIEVDNWHPTIDPNAKRRRVGVIVQTLNSLTDTYTVLPAIAAIDRSEFEVVIMTLSVSSTQGPYTPMEQYALTLADKVNVVSGNVAEIINAVRAENLEFLLIGNNITAVSSQLFLVCTARLATHQIAFNPCCTTTGLKNVDYFVSGRSVEPLMDAQDHYSEKLILLDGPAHVRLIPPFETYTPPSTISKRKDGKVRFVSGANYFKLTPQTRKTWLILMTRVRNSTLSLYPFGPAWSNVYDKAKLVGLLFKEAAQMRVDPKRIVLLEPFETVQAMHAYLINTDIYLDSFPFSGINSLLDPLSSGIPFVSLAGRDFRSNMGASVLKEIGIPELLAETKDEYIDIAVGLASNGEILKGYKQRVVDVMNRHHKLYDSLWYSAEFSKIFRQISNDSSR